MPIVAHPGEVVRLLRRGLTSTTLAALAQKTGTSEAHLSLIERGLRASYGIGTVAGDNWAKGWLGAAFDEQALVALRFCERGRRIPEPHRFGINGRRVELLAHERLLGQLASLERRVGTGGHETIDHGPAGHDDLANSVAGALALVLHEASRPPVMVW